MANLQPHNEQTSPDVRLWYCEHCRNVHLRTQNVMLDFSKKEFVEVTKAMLEILQDNFDPLEISRLSNSSEPADDILSSEVVS